MSALKIELCMFTYLGMHLLIFHILHLITFIPEDERVKFSINPRASIRDTAIA